MYKIWFLQLDCTSITNVTKLPAEFLKFWNAFYFPFSFSVLIFCRSLPSLLICDIFAQVFPIFTAVSINSLKFAPVALKMSWCPFEASHYIIHHFQHQRLTSVRGKFAANKPCPASRCVFRWKKWNYKTNLESSTSTV